MPRKPNTVQQMLEGTVEKGEPDKFQQVLDLVKDHIFSPGDRVVHVGRRFYIIVDGVRESVDFRDQGTVKGFLDDGRVLVIFDSQPKQAVKMDPADIQKLEEKETRKKNKQKKRKQGSKFKFTRFNIDHRHPRYQNPDYKRQVENKRKEMLIDNEASIGGKRKRSVNPYSSQKRLGDDIVKKRNNFKIRNNLDRNINTPAAKDFGINIGFDRGHLGHGLDQRYDNNGNIGFVGRKQKQSLGEDDFFRSLKSSDHSVTPHEDFQRIYAWNHDESRDEGWIDEALQSND